MIPRRLSIGLVGLIVIGATAAVAVLGLGSVAASSCSLGTATIVWVGGTGTQSWQVATNWQDVTTSANRVPGAADHACVGTVGVTVQHTNGTTQILGVEVVPGAALSVQDGSTLRLTDSVVASQAATVSLSNGGTFTADSDLNVMNLIQAPGSNVINGSGHITVSGSYSQGSSTTTSGMGTTTISSGATWGAAGAIGRPVQLAAGASGTISSLGVESGGSIANAGSLAVNGTIATGGTVANSGMLTHASGFAAINSTFTNSGTVQVSGGTLSLAGGSTSSGAYQVSSGAVLEIANGTHTFQAAASIAGPGSVSVINGNLATFDSGMSFTAANLSTGNGGTLTTNTDFTVANVTQPPGGSLINGSGNITISASYTQGSGGTMSGTGTTTIANGASWTTNGALGRPLQLQSGATGAITGLTMNTGGSLANAGSLVLNGSIVGGSFGNSGTLTHASGSSANTAAFANSGTVQVTAGTLNLGGGGTSSGAYLVSAGATLEIGNGTHTFQAASSITGLGSVAVINGNQATFDSGMTFSVKGLSLTNGGNLTTNTDFSVVSISQSVSSINGSGDITVTGSYSQGSGAVMSGTGMTTIATGATWSAQGALGRPLRVQSGATGTIFGLTIQTGGAVTNDGSVSMQGDFGQDGTPAGLTNNGALTVASGSREIRVPFTNNSLVSITGGSLTLPMNFGATFTNYNQATDVLTGGTYEVTGTFRFAGADIVTNQASLVLDGAAAQILDMSSLDGLRNFVTNGANGSLQLENGRNLTRGGAALISAGTVNIGFGSVLSAASLNVTGGFLRGGGTVAAAVTNSAGTVAPGLSPGTLTINGNYTQAAGGKLSVDIGGNVAGTGYDQLAVTGGASLAGTLVIATDPAFAPAPADTFEIISASSASGAFTTVQGQNSSPGRLYSVGYGPADVVLTVSPVTSCSPGTATIVWDGGTGFKSWDTPGNWRDVATNGDRIPTTSDHVCIDTSGARVQLSDSSATVKGLEVAAGAELQVRSSVLTLTDTVIPSRISELVEGTSATLANPTITGAANVTITASFTLNAGTHSGPGVTTIADGAQWSVHTGTVTGGRVVAIGSGASGSVNLGLSLAGGGSVTNDGTLALDAGDGASISGTNPGSLTNSGLIRTDGSGVATVSVPFTNTGTVSVTEGTLDVTSPAHTSSGDYLVSSVLRFSRGSSIFETGSSITGAGFVDVGGNSNTVSVETGVTFSIGSLHIEAGQLASDANIAVGTLSQGSLGTLAGSGNVTVTTSYALAANATLTGSGELSVSTGATCSISGGRLDGGRAVSLQAGVLTSVSGVLVMANGATLSNAGSMTFSGFGGLDDINDGGSAGTFNNAGTATKTSTGTTTFGVPFANSGSVLVNSGTVSVTGDQTSSGAFVVPAGSTLSLGNATHNLAAASSISGGGTLSVSGSLNTTKLAAGATVSVPVVQLSNSADLIADTDLALVTLAQSTAAALSGSGDITISGSYSQAGNAAGSGRTTISSGAAWTWTTGTLAGRTIEVEAGASGSITGSHAVSAGGAISNAGGLTLSGSPSLNNTGTAGALTNTGTLTKDLVGTALVSLPVTNPGALQVTAGTLALTGLFSNYDQATDVLSGGTYNVLGTLQFNGADIVTNQANVTLDGAAARIQESAPNNGLRNFVTNGASGSLTLMNGASLDRSGANLGNAGALNVGSSSTLTASSLTLTGGTLAGAGTVVANVINQAGTVTPGSSPGQLSVGGDYTQGAAGLLTVEITGTAANEYDRLAVAGSATLDGTLTIVTAAGFTPASGAAFQIISSSTETGSFSSVIGASLGDRSYVAQYAVDGVHLVVTSVVGCSIVGTPGDDVLTGTPFDDYICGLGGNDVLIGGLGDDTLDGGDGNDTVSYESASAGVRVDLRTGVVTGGGGSDTIVIGSVENLDGSIYQDVLEGDSGANVLNGLAGSDTLDGNTGNNTLRGGDGNDWLIGGAGNDVIDGGLGHDRVEYGRSSSGVTISLAGGFAGGLGAGSDSIAIGSIEVVSGSDFADSIEGGTGPDVIIANGGDDLLDGGLDGDEIYGGQGTDRVLYAGAASGVTSALATDHVTVTDGIGTDAAYDVEGITGSQFADSLAGFTLMSGLGGDDVLAPLLAHGLHFDGGPGRDVLDFSSATAAVAVNLATGQITSTSPPVPISTIEDVIGSPFGDTLTGNAGANSLRGGPGNDTLASSGSNDFLDGGSGIDVATYAGATGGVSVSLAVVTPGLGADAFSAVENLVGSPFDDVLTGDGGTNLLAGGLGSDTLDGAGGNDTLDGGFGVDTASYASAPSSVTANLAAGTSTGGAGSDTYVLASGTSTIENLTGSSFDDLLIGSEVSLVANLLNGGPGNDILQGGPGGNNGRDTFDGGSGTDTVTYAAYPHGVQANLAVGSVTGGASADTILPGTVENLTGSAFTDSLTGDTGPNAILGLAGDDAVNGSPGVDTMDGGAGTDWLFFSSSQSGVMVNLAAGTDSDGDALSGFENISGSLFDDLLIGDVGPNQILGQLGDDVIEGGLGVDSVDGQDGIDTISFASAPAAVTVNFATHLVSGGAGTEDLGFSNGRFENIAGSAFSDSLTGSGASNLIDGLAGNDTVNGASGDDLLVGGPGNDALIGGTGTDTASYATAPSGMSANLNTGTASGGAGSDTLSAIENLAGSPFNDILTGNSAINILQGADGNDSLDGLAGDDILDGGVGSDTAPYFSAGTAVTVNLALGTSAGGAGADTLVAIENIDGSSFNDTLIGDANANRLGGAGGNDSIDGGPGADTLNGGAGTDTASCATSTTGVTVNLTTGTSSEGDVLSLFENVTGSPNDDVLIGNASANVMAGLGGSDMLDGMAGNDTLNGGAGNDTVSYESASAAVTVNLGAGTASGAAGNDTLVTGTIENATGSAFNDTLTGDGLANSLAGGAGGDTLDGGLGDDQLEGGPGVDTLTLAKAPSAENVNLVTGSAVGGLGADTIFVVAGFSTVENVTGSPYADSLMGDGGPNVLLGGNSNDTLEGGLGDDTLNGQAGTDTVSFATSPSLVDANLVTGAVSGGEGHDTITVGTVENLAGSAFNDQLIGDGSANVLSGGAGADIFQGGPGNDTFDGGQGQDMVDYGNAVSAVVVNLGLGTATGEGQDTLVRSGGLCTVERVHGSQYADTLTGDDGPNRLDGYSGSDIIDGGPGDDSIDGGPAAFFFDQDVDTVTYASAPSAVSVDLLTGLVTGGAGADIIVRDASSQLSSIDNITGSAFNDTLTGDSRSNTILGGSGDDVLDGRGYPDTLNGGPGVDTVTYASLLNGVTVNLTTGIVSGNGIDPNNPGADTITMDTVENVVGSRFNDTITGDGRSNLIDGGLGDDAIDGGAGTDTVTYSTAPSSVIANLMTGAASGGAGVDTFVGGRIENLIGSSFDDVLTGNDGANMLSAGPGNDTIEGRQGIDTIDGGAGIDTASYANAIDNVSINLAVPSVSGGAGADLIVAVGGASTIENLIGSAFADTLTGDSATNTLAGGAGNDTLAGGPGNDQLDGGPGVDTASYTSAPSGMTANLASGIATGGAGSDTFVSGTIENLTGSAFADTLLGDASANVLAGGDGNDALDGAAGNDSVDGGPGVDTLTYSSAPAAITVSLTAGTATGGAGSDTITVGTVENITGSAFADTLIGDSAANRLLGGQGNDILNGRTGADRLDGGTGIDTVSYANASAGVSANLATGLASGGDGSDTIVDGTIENLVGSDLADTLTGDAGANSLVGSSGNDVLDGGPGDDTLDGSNGIDTVSYASATGGVVANLSTGTASGAAGTDSIVIGTVDNLTGSPFADQLTGDAGANQLAGTGGADTLTGLAGADTLLGGGGDDLLEGGLGNDVLDGGSGVDTISYASATDNVSIRLDTGSASGGAGSDSIEISTVENAIGSAFNDTLVGDGDGNVLQGGAGDDTLDIQDGISGNDTADGGTGTDACTADPGDTVIGCP